MCIRDSFGNILFQKIKGSHFFQTVFFLPSVICGVAVGLTWTFVYNSEFGLINKFLEMIGLGSLKQVWLADKNLALFCIIIVVMWQFVGYHMIIQIAAMKNISAVSYTHLDVYKRQNEDSRTWHRQKKDHHNESSFRYFPSQYFWDEEYV